MVLHCTDDVVGTGAMVTVGATVTVQYVGVGQVGGEEFDSSWEAGPATFSLTQVIQGWRQGLVGMREGGRRTLVIPGRLAYGGGGNASAGIGPDETLVFTIDLLSVEP